MPIAVPSGITVVFGQPLKRIAAWVGDAEKSMGDIVITHYGLESG
jgi:hypothetical protein